MNYIWTEDTGAGLHYWQLINKYLFENQFIIESKGSNQGILDAVRELRPTEGDQYYLAFDIVYDNMDVMNKYLELKELASKHPEQIIILDIICFEYIILSFHKLIEWTGSNKKDKISIRKNILSSMKGHKIDLEQITDSKTREYFMRFKRYSTERVMKALTYELTENNQWSVKGMQMGQCWYQNCCVEKNSDKTRCNLNEKMSGKEKLMALFMDSATQNIIDVMQTKRGILEIHMESNTK